METIRRENGGLNEQEFLERYDPARYDRPSVTVDAVVFTVTEEEQSDVRRLPDKALRVLMIRRGEYPFLHQWALPGGFVRTDESLNAAVARELKDEAGLTGLYLEQLYTWGDVGRDPRTRVISVSYMALADASRLNLRAGDDAADARWFTVRERTVRTDRVETETGYKVDRHVQLILSGGGEELSADLIVSRLVEGHRTVSDRAVVNSGSIAFDHARIIHYALDRLRNKLEWTDVAFSLVPERFTVKELQKVYEVILGREILDMQFRRNMERLILPTNEMRTNVGHRPARLFRFNPEWANQ